MYKIARERTKYADTRRSNALLLTTECRYTCDGQQRIWTTGGLNYDALSEYLVVFSQVWVAGRVRSGSPPLGAERADGPEIHFIDTSLSSIRNIIRLGLLLRDWCGPIILRAPGVVASLVGIMLHAIRRGYDVEVVAHAYQTLSRHGGRLQGLAAAPLEGITRRLVSNADNAAYVTKKYLQEVYPTRGRAYWCPDVLIRNVVSVEVLRSSSEDEVVVGMIGALDRHYKGAADAVRVVALLREWGIRASLEVVGSGNSEPYYELAEDLNVHQWVTFLGHLEHQKVFGWLKGLDVYLQPSYAEAAPRGLIEAMASGVPAIASAVGGISEILDSKHLHPPGDYDAAARLVTALLRNPGAYTQAREAANRIANDYAVDRVRFRRLRFFRAVRGKATV